MSMVGNLRKVTSLTRRNRRRVDLSHPARSPLGSSVVN
jgi:magnesium transporter